MLDIGLVPERTADPGTARALLDRDGAVLLEGGGDSADDALRGTSAVLGDRLRMYRTPVAIGANPRPQPGDGSFFDPVARKVNANNLERGPLHVDGYMVYGTSYPDVVTLLCVRQADVGGESILLDGWRLLAALSADGTTRDLHHFVWSVPLEQSTPSGIRVAAPIACRTPGGRIVLRCHDSQRLPDDRHHDPGDQTLLDRWYALTEAAAAAAPRFRLRPGDLFFLDNYRMFHAREAYRGGDRLLHRIWAWTDAALGLPDLAPLPGRTADLVPVAP